MHQLQAEDTQHISPDTTAVAHDAWCLVVLHLACPRQEGLQQVCKAAHVCSSL